MAATNAIPAIAIAPAAATAVGPATPGLVDVEPEEEPGEVEVLEASATRQT